TIMTMMFCVVMIRYGLYLTIKFMNQTSPAMQIPMGIIYLIAPIFGLILILFAVEQLILQLRQPKEEV
ncbi:MAG TPA: TRAP transporter small permease subunit, partial [Clostridia bacterium]|nr:TRAP transporter small permease subunit [Clostridia bacterium]